jgi:hypothetical protein
VVTSWGAGELVPRGILGVLNLPISNLVINGENNLVIIYPIMVNNLVNHGDK